MILTEYDEKKHMKSIYNEGRADGWNEGHEAGIEVGRKAGIEKGLAVGREEKLIQQVCRKLRKGKLPELIAEELEEELDVIVSICAAAEEFAPDFDFEQVWKKVQKKQKVSR